MTWVGGEDWVGTNVPGCCWAASTALTAGLELLISPVQPRGPRGRGRVLPDLQLSQASASALSCGRVLQGPQGPVKHQALAAPGTPRAPPAVHCAPPDVHCAPQQLHGNAPSLSARRGCTGLPGRTVVPDAAFPIASCGSVWAWSWASSVRCSGLGAARAGPLEPGGAQQGQGMGLQADL